jgi:hypothetical protein
MATTAAQMANYFYSEDEAPEDAFSWWLSPCGGSELVPEEIKKLFDILNSIPDGISSFKKPRDGKGKGTGKKGDEANPTDRASSKPGTGKGPNGTGGSSTKKKCRIRPGDDLKRMGPAKNTLRSMKCVADKTVKEDLIATSLRYKSNPTLHPVVEHCDQAHTQACYHYSSVIRNNPAWQTLTCPPEAAATSWKMARSAPRLWNNQHNGGSNAWLDEKYRQEKDCERDEYPPIYLMGPSSPAFLNAGRNVQGQMIRFLPMLENKGGGQKWKSICFMTPLQNAQMNDNEFRRRFNAAPSRTSRSQKGLTQILALLEVEHQPEFSFGSWGHSGQPARDDGLWDNPCWPQMLAPTDPGFALFTYDQWYGGQSPPDDYTGPI